MMRHAESGWQDLNTCEHTTVGKERKHEVRDMRYFGMHEVQGVLMNSCEEPR